MKMCCYVYCILKLPCIDKMFLGLEKGCKSVKLMTGASQVVCAMSGNSNYYLLCQRYKYVFFLEYTFLLPCAIFPLY